MYYTGDVTDVTIIIPIYCPTEESVEWLRECIVSAKATGANISAWCDGTPYISRVRTILSDYGVDFHGSVKNHGPSYARNRAVELVKTRYILPLDNDDTIREDAIDILLNKWYNKPLIPDLSLFGSENKKHYRLKEWSCDAQKKILGIASVSVFHTLDQHKQVGGWDESLGRLDLYEDAEYNARLLLEFCGENVREPLIQYRRHAGSRMHLSSTGKKNTLALQMLERTGGYEKMCCGKKKVNSLLSNQRTDSAASSDIDPTSMDAMQGDRVLAQYVGGQGMGRHNYKGQATKLLYRVVYGDFVYAHPDDVKDASDIHNNSLLIRFHPQETTNEETTDTHSKSLQLEDEAAKVTEVVDTHDKVTPRITPEKKPVFTKVKRIRKPRRGTDG